MSSELQNLLDRAKTGRYSMPIWEYHGMIREAEELLKLKAIAERMHTLCFNGANDPTVPEEYRESMKRFSDSWLEVLRSNGL